MSEDKAQRYAKMFIAMVLHIMIMLVVAFLFMLIWNKWLSYEFNLNYINYTTALAITFLYKLLAIVAKGSKYE